MRRGLYLFALLAVGAAACGGAQSTAINVPPGALPGGTTTHVALPAGPNPSESARMVCGSKTQQELASSLGVSPTAPVAPTWVDHLYSCRLAYGNGAFTMSVKELSSTAETTAYFNLLANQLGDAGPLNGLGQGAFTTRDGSVVARKDYKVLLVDISGLPPSFGVPATSAADVAVTVADTVMGCWTGE